MQENAVYQSKFWTSVTKCLGSDPMRMIKRWISSLSIIGRVGTRTRRSLNQLDHVPRNSTSNCFLAGYPLSLMAACVQGPDWACILSTKSRNSWYSSRFHPWFMQLVCYAEKMTWWIVLGARVGLLRPLRGAKKNTAMLRDRNFVSKNPQTILRLAPEIRVSRRFSKKSEQNYDWTWPGDFFSHQKDD